MNLLNFSRFCDFDQCQEAFGSQTAGLENWPQQEVLGDSWYPRDWRVHGSSVGPRLLTEGRTLALALGHQLPSTTSLGAYRIWTNSGGNWNLCKTTRRQKKKNGDLVFIYALLKMVQPCPWKAGPSFLHPWNTFPLDNAYTHKLKSWIITGFIYMYFLALIYDMVFLGLNCISSAFSNTDYFN